MKKQYFSNKLIAIYLISLLVLSCGQEKTDNEKGFVAQEDNSAEIQESTLNYDLDTFSVLSTLSDVMEDKAYKLSEDLKKMVPKVSFGGANYHVIEGDLLMDNDELYTYCQKRLILDTLQEGTDTKKLTIATLPDGTWARWPENYVIKYSVLKKSFNSSQNYLNMVEMFKKATQDWMDVANIKFEYVPTYDNMTPDANPIDDLTFVVREFNARGAYIAMSFFPGEPVYRRKVFIDPSFYSVQASMVGVLRHELGHILGFRHEHIWNDGCTSEKIVEGYLGATPLTKYDPYSVMHYPCKNLGTYSMKLTEFDKDGIVQVYGKAKR